MPLVHSNFAASLNKDMKKIELNIKLKMKKLITILLCIGVSYLSAQTILTGKVKDDKGQPVPMAMVKVENQSMGAKADANGQYKITFPAAGTYTLVVSYIGFEKETVQVAVAENQTTERNITLTASTKQIKSVKITGARRKSTESAVLQEVKEAKQIVSAISAEQMSKGTDNNAAQAIQRVPGITITDGRFVNVRGLSERYNNVLINNAIAPSTEVDRRTFSFDLLPTSTLEKMTISKTAAAYMPGDFSGGLIGITTSENFSDFTQVSFGLGYRVNTTFTDYVQSQGSPTDFLGIDNGFRQLPSNFPTDRNALNDNATSVQFAHQLPNNFSSSQSTAFLESGLNFSFGRTFKMKGNKNLSTVNMISYSNKFQNYQKDVNTFINDFTSTITTAQLQRDFSDQYYSNEARVTLLSNWSLRLDSNNKITLKNLYNQIGENFSTLRQGYDLDQRQGQILKNYEYGFSGRRILTSQLNGEHKLPKNQKLTWLLGGNAINDILPDLRRFRTFRIENRPEDSFRMIDPPSSNPFDAGRFYSALNEVTGSAALNYTLEIEQVKGEEDLGNIILKTGLFSDYKARDFSARYFSYVIPGNVNISRREELIQQPLSTIFSQPNVTAANGWVLREGSNQSDSYDASNLLFGGYLYGELPVNKFLLAGGVRLENNILKVNGFQGFQPLVVEQPILSILPSLNISYNINPKNVLRLAYSRTVNRPEFREIAPFLFYNFKEDTEVDGNKDLTTATIDNFDFRYEIYPTKQETASLGLFYKRFDRPIEFTLPTVSQQRRMRYTNSNSAMIYGAELELRKSFKEIFRTGFLSDLSVNLNASYIFSEVDLGTAVAAQDRTRALQGQSPYVVNLALGYSNKANGWDANIIYNRFGDRIYSVGSQQWATIYELARDQVDITISKTFKKLTYKFGVSNLLNTKFQFYQDSNLDKKIDDNDDAVFVHRLGAAFNFNITYKF